VVANFGSTCSPGPLAITVFTAGSVAHCAEAADENRTSSDATRGRERRFMKGRFFVVDAVVERGRGCRAVARRAG
jgi:hypothetical protein